MKYKVADIVDALGGPTAAARALGIRAPSVIEWRTRNRVPIERCAAVEALTAGRFRRWGMRPSDWHEIWPELVGADGAPPVPGVSATTAA